MVCVYTFVNGDVVTGKPALKAYLAANLASLLPDRAEQAGFKRTPLQRAISVPREQVEMVERIGNDLAAKLANPPEIVVFTDMQDPRIDQIIRDADARQKAGGAKGEPEGFYFRGKAYLNATIIKTPKDAARVFAHEVLGHYGLRGLYGKALKGELQRIVDLRKKDVLAKAKEYGLDVNDPAALLEAAEEVLANMAQNTPDIGFVKRVVAAIRSWLRENVPGFSSMELSDSEIIRDYILPARAFVERGAQAGRELAANPRFNRALPQEESGILTMPEQNILRRVQAAMQDNLNRVRELQEKIQKVTGKAVPEFANYYGAETNRPGRIAARLEDGRNDMFEPLMAGLAKAGRTPEQLSELLHAMHAHERNETIAEINEDMPDGGSGMTNAEADAILEKYKNDRALHAWADKAREIAQTTLELKLAYGRIDIDTFTQLATHYTHYVPLKGDGEYGAKVKRAMGHEAREEYILQNLARDYELAVVDGEKNTARQALLQMALTNPDPSLWTVNIPPRGRYVAGTVFSVMHGKERVATFTSMSQVSAYLEGLGPKASRLEVFANGEQVKEFVKPLQDNEVPVYVDGQLVRIQIHDEKLASQLRPLNRGQMNPILGFLQSANRYFAKIYTGYNPAFILRNTARDALTGSMNIVGNEGAAMAARAWGNYPAAMASLSTYAATGKVPNTEAGKLLSEYRQFGGKTGASYMSDLEEQGKTLQRMYDDAYGASGYLKDGKAGKAAIIAGRKIVGGMAHAIEVMNQATENGLRLALFMALRKHGVSAGEAAQAAKNVTVNFDRKGEQTGVLSAIYLFFNPAVQGTANAIKTLAKGKHKEQAWVAAGALAALGFYAATAGMDDDEDKWLGEGWENRSRNLILNVGGSRIKVPLSIEFSPFYAAGVAIAEAKRGTISAGKAAGHLVSSFIDAYFPLQGAYSPESDNPGLDASIAAVPTLLKTPVQVMANRNSFGSQVVPDNEFTKYRPDNLKMYRGSKGSAFDATAQGIAAAGVLAGAGKYENDITKVSPETLKFLWRTYTGGLGQFVTDVGGLANIAAQAPGSIEVSDVPVAKDFVKSNDDTRLLRGRYYDLTKEARKASEEFRQAKKAGDSDAMDKILSSPDKEEMIILSKFILSTNKAAAAIRDEMVDINADTSLSLPEKRAKLKELERDEAELYRDAIETFR